jgi:hypothetical protein
MSYQQLTNPPQANAAVVINENMDSLGQAFLWSHDQAADSGLTIGLHGGEYNEAAIADVTLDCTDDETNLICVDRLTLELFLEAGSSSSAHWEDTVTYGRIARAVFVGGVLTWHDERFSQGGIFDYSAQVAIPDAADIPLEDAGDYFTTDNVEAALQEIGAVLDTIPSDLATQPFDVLAFYPGLPDASALLTRVPVARAIDFPADFAGSYAKASAAATGSVDFDVTKNGSTIGTINFNTSATGTFTTSGGSAQSLAAGDVLAITAPGSPDATLADVGIVLAGTR